eukprot:3470904-Heterocapsa_arctica.AAC.1
MPRRWQNKQPCKYNKLRMTRNKHVKNKLTSTIDYLDTIPHGTAALPELAMCSSPIQAFHGP